MKLHKKSRERIYAAAPKREPVWVMWPKKEPRPVMGEKYRVSGFPSECRILCVDRRKLKSGRYKALLKLDHDPSRVLYGLQGQRSEEGDYQPEPERVPARYEALIAQEGVLKTIFAGNRNRQREELIRQEKRLAEVRRRKMTKAEGRVVGRINRLRTDLEEAA